MTEKRFTNTDNGFIVDYESKQKVLNLYDVVELLNEFNDENEQLKQRNTRQAKQLDRLYNLIEQKDWRALNDILDDFKRCEEQLRKEWETYGDLE